jgi:signal transduction histidine kinase
MDATSVMMNNNEPRHTQLESLPTQFASAERAIPQAVAAQAQRFAAALPEMHAILDAVPDAVVMLNRHRQIIFANHSTLTLLGRDNGQLLGLRPGEALNCMHAYESAGGCGTTAFCSTCGAVRAILRSQRGEADVQECRIIIRGSSDALDLRVWTVPFKLGDEKLTIFTIHDIRDEKRRRALERIFFHDVLNTAGAISASTEIILDAGSAQPGEFIQLLSVLADRLIEEVKSQRDLLSAENNELAANWARIDGGALVNAMADSYRLHPAAEGRFIQVAPLQAETTFISDPVLLRRVLGNMLKNALEATEPGDTVTLGCRLHGDKIEFWVHNPTVMPRDVQLQVFQRSFSTKGNGRGLGTYSMRLLSERYLGGHVTFDSSPVEGTTFRALYPLEISAN